MSDEPTYKWDCPECVFVGDHTDSWGVYSLYVHYRPEHKGMWLSHDLIAVYSGGSHPDYQSGHADEYREPRERDGWVSPLRVALERAVAQGVAGFGKELLA